MTYTTRVDETLRAIAEPHRREILRLVWDTELAASQIAGHFSDVSRPAISQHLRVLKEANLLDERRDATRRLYRTNVGELATLRSSLEGFWMSGLTRLADAAEQVEKMRGI